MPRELTVGVIGDFNPEYHSHTATNLSFRHAATPLGVSVDIKWVPTPSLEKHVEEKLGQFDVLLCAPGSPYKSMRGALNGIRFAREPDRPFLGTCGGFQHVVIEYARNVMGFADAQLAEELAREAVALGGTVSGEHGIGKLKRKMLGIQYDEAAINQMLATKKALDPNLILDPRNIFAETETKEYVH